MSSEGRDSISQLVSRFQSGIDREESFREVFLRFHWPVRRFFGRKGFSEDEVGDLTQDTFLRIFKALDTFRADSSFEAWIYGIAAHVYYNELRRRKAEKREGIESSLDAPLYQERQSPVEDFLSLPGQLEGVLEREKLEALRSALQSLPPQMRRCCMLRYEKGFKYQEIAAILGVSIDTVKAQLYQARKRLADKLRDESRQF